MIRNPFRVLTPAEMLAKQLADSERSRVTYMSLHEEMTHTLNMLNARIARIRKELQAMTTTEQKENQ
jgi:histidinol-phosphate/aromatic aminotransferase/cobyric acid decarboxylase-like protein